MMILFSRCLESLPPKNCARVRTLMHVKYLWSTSPSRLPGRDIAQQEQPFRFYLTCLIFSRWQIVKLCSKQSSWKSPPGENQSSLPQERTIFFGSATICFVGCQEPRTLSFVEEFCCFWQSSFRSQKDQD